MKKTLLILLLGLLSLSAFPQNEKIYYAYYNEGVKYYNKGDYLVSLQKFNESLKYAVTQTHKDKANAYITKCINAAQQQKIDLQNALKKAEIEKNRADSALKVANLALEKAELMQQKVETAMFDKAVKERNKE